MFAKARASDEAEDAQFGQARSDEPPAGLRSRAEPPRRFAQAKALLSGELAAERAVH
jgi:hypothetical protein